MEDKERRIHLIGIGGSGMSAIALVLLQSGYSVSGSDRQKSPLVQSLEEAGARVYIGHKAEHIHGAQLIVRSSAIRDDNPEVQAGLKAGIPVMKRADFLGRLTEGKRVVAVAGSHGKTTTTAMIAWLLKSLGEDPSYIIGGVSINLGNNAHAGKGGTFVIEADEYDHMFLGLNPDIAVVTNVEHDHPDCYPTPEDFYQAFATFTRRMAADGILIANGEDAGAARLLKETSDSGRSAFSYGVQDVEDLDHLYRATNLSFNSKIGGFSFDFSVAGNLITPVHLQIAGEHNVRNAMGSLAAAHQMGISLTDAAGALAGFRGVGRRFDVRGEAAGVTIIDDYAHHPTEIRATLAAARQAYPRQPLWVVWQPHTFSRSRMLFDQFVASFQQADHVLVTDIFAAREPAAADFSGSQFVEALRKIGQADARFTGSLRETGDQLLKNLHAGEVLIVLSAGDADEISRRVFNELPRHLSHPLRKTQSKIFKQASQALQPAFGERLEADVSLARYTSMRVGGPADALLVVRNADELARAAAALWQANLPFIILGSGSNVLASDAGLRGIAIVNQAQAIYFAEKDEAGAPSVTAESGANFGLIARQAGQRGLGGLEWACGIPGTLGGAVIGNAGAHGGEMSACLMVADILQHNKVAALDSGVHTDPEAMKETWSVDKMEYAYRTSVLKRHPGAAIVLSAKLHLERKAEREIQAHMEEYVAYRRRTQPVGASTGSIFKNPGGDYAGRLIEACHLKGVRQGGAEISSVHANFFINLGQASASDIWALIRMAREKVAEQFGVDLELEIERIGAWDA